MIARNRATEFHRNARPADELTEDHSRSERPTAEAKEILAAIRSLPEAYSETLVLRLVEGMSGQEIAKRTGLKPESVRVNCPGHEAPAAKARDHGVSNENGRLSLGQNWRRRGNRKT